MPAWQDAGAARGKRACRHCLLPAVAGACIADPAGWLLDAGLHAPAWLLSSGQPGASR
jgi:hypothetical protein